MNRITIDYDEFHDRLLEVLDKRKFHEENPARAGWSFDLGASTMFYESCAIMLQMDNERMQKELEASA